MSHRDKEERGAFLAVIPAQIESATVVLGGADLSEAYFIGANLSGAQFFGTNLSGADLNEANLSEAYLVGANLSGAKLLEANLVGANLSNANLTSAKGVTIEELEKQAKSLAGATMPDGTKHP